MTLGFVVAPIFSFLALSSKNVEKNVRSMLSNFSKISVRFQELTVDWAFDFMCSNLQLSATEINTDFLNKNSMIAQYKAGFELVLNELTIYQLFCKAFD